MAKVVLLGDSSFDNESYVDGGKSVLQHCQEQLPIPSILAAQDGGVISDVQDQMKAHKFKHDDYAVVSVGGNDALGNIDLLSMPTKNSFQFLLEVSERVKEFEKDYRKMLQYVLEHGAPIAHTAVCTVYNPNFEDEGQQAAGVQALKFFNDIILKYAFRSSVSVIDYRLLFSHKKDYANDIEPSVIGGLKITEAIKRFISSRVSQSRVIC